MDILMVSAELSPYAAQTAAGDAVFSLSKALRQLGHDVTIALPRYASFEESGLLLARRLTGLTLPSGGEVHLFDGQLASGVKLVLFDAPVLFERSGIYGDVEDYPDNLRRFALLCEGAIALIRQRRDQGKAFDIAHLHDWPAALVAGALSGLADLSLPCVLTVYDAERQGVFPRADCEALSTLEDLMDAASWTEREQLNVLCESVPFADVVTTVSDEYAGKIRAGECGKDLGEVLKHSDRQLTVIPTGIDYAIFNPATDPALDSRFDAEDPSNKGRCKVALLRDVGLEFDMERPLFVATSQAEVSSGLEVIVRALPRLSKCDLNLVVSGGQNSALDKKLEEAAARYPESFAFVRSPTEATERRLLAAADFFISPRRHEPGAESVLKAQRYGAVPIVHAFPGAADRVVDCDVELETGTGFLFEPLTSSALVAAVQRARASYPRVGFGKLRRRIMRLDLSWDRPARRYLQLYRQSVGAHA